jgi:hypothetical protein
MTEIRREVAAHRDRRRLHSMHAERMVIERVRQENAEGYDADHDAAHEQHEWVGLIAMYASAGDWIKVGALAIAAEEAEEDEHY